MILELTISYNLEQTRAKQIIETIQKLTGVNTVKLTD
jgi:hypothetical protein